jgi:hypothetical protein
VGEGREGDAAVAVNMTTKPRVLRMHGSGPLATRDDPSTIPTIAKMVIDHARKKEKFLSPRLLAHPSQQPKRRRIASLPLAVPSSGHRLFIPSLCEYF